MNLESSLGNVGDVVRDKIIVLIGMMGVGKSSIGNQLAKQLGMMFYDSDHEIEKAAGVSSTAIYEQFGEPAFRDVELSVLRRLLNYSPHILSTGDSTFLHKEIRDQLLAKTVTIWLHSDAQTIYKRLKNSRVRPQLVGADPEKTLEILVRDRERTYSLAHIKVSSDDQTYERMVSRVIKSYVAYSKLSVADKAKLVPGEPFCIDDCDDVADERRLIVMRSTGRDDEPDAPLERSPGPEDSTLF